MDIFWQFQWYQVICTNGPEVIFAKKSKFHDAGGPDTVVSPCIVRYAYSAEELEQVTLWDVANTDHAVSTLHTLAAGDQPFFYVMGFHKVTRGVTIGTYRVSHKTVCT